MASSARRRKIDLVILLITLLFGIAITLNARALGDWWFFRTYKPPVEISKLADDAGMNEAGRHLFYRFSPQVVDRQKLAEVCGSNLGCTEGRRIYILESTTQREYERNIVTAAHEMLHVAWSRMSREEKSAVADAMEDQLTTNYALKTNEEVQPYKNDDYLEDYTNEAWAYTGSEVEVVDSRLIPLYNRYFSDRTQTVSAYMRSPEDIE